MEKQPKREDELVNDIIMELHIFGPAFSLPSIDAECNAATAYMSEAVPFARWKLVLSHDASFSPTGSFPALRDGSACIGGFQAIVDYLRTRRPESYDLDAGFDAMQLADSIAFKTYLQSNALPLIDVSLYVSYENHYHTTRPAFTALLPWHTNYIIPPARRAAAKARTQHLGLAGLDVDESASDTSRTESIGARYEKEKRLAGLSDVSAAQPARPGPRPGAPRPRSTFGFKKSVTNAVNEQGYSARFRLDALATACFAPLEEQLGSKRFLVSTVERPSSVDCLAFGYLSLALFPSVPNKFLSTALRTKFPRLASYVVEMKQLFTDGDVRPDEVLGLTVTACQHRDSARAKQTNNLKLPWWPAERPTALATAAKISREVVGTIPLLNFMIDNNDIISQTKHHHPPPSSSPSTPSQLLSFVTIPSAFLATALLTTVGVITYTYAHTDFLRNESASSRGGSGGKLSDFGEAGAALAVLGDAVELEKTRREHERERQRGKAVVEVRADVDVEPIAT